MGVLDSRVSAVEFHRSTTPRPPRRSPGRKDEFPRATPRCRLTGLYVRWFVRPKVGSRQTAVGVLSVTDRSLFRLRLAVRITSPTVVSHPSDVWQSHVMRLSSAII